MRLATVLGCLTVAALHPSLAALAADPPVAPAAPTKDASASVEAPAAAPPTQSAPAAASAPAATPAQVDADKAAPQSAPATASAPAAAPAKVDADKAAPQSAPATATAPTATPAKVDADEAQLEKSLSAKGYTMHMRSGDKVFCRREAVIGSRLGGALHCMTADEARNNENRARLDAEQMQKVVGPCIATGSKGVNCGN